MKDPEARRRLREILEFQMKEKQDAQSREPSRGKTRAVMRNGSRPPMGQGLAVLNQSAGAGLLPPLNVRHATPTNMMQSLTPKRMN